MGPRMSKDAARGHGLIDGVRGMMYWFRDLSVRWKLFGGFGVVLGLMVLVGYLGLATMARLDAMLDAAVLAMQNGNVEAAQRMSDEASAAYQTARLQMLALLAVAVVLGLG